MDLNLKEILEHTNFFLNRFNINHLNKKKGRFIYFLFSRNIKTEILGLSMNKKALNSTSFLKRKKKQYWSRYQYSKSLNQKRLFQINNTIDTL